jgi:hypothetical protein
MNLKSNCSGLPKLIYDTGKHRSNISEVEKLLNFLVQQRFTTLHDCIATRSLREIPEPKAPTASTLLPSISSSSSSSSTSTSTSKPRSKTVTSATSATASDPDLVAPALVYSSQLELEVEMAIYTQKYKQYLLKLGKREDELSQLFGLVDELLSVSSKERVIAHSNFEIASESRNGSQLWNIVFETHQLIDMFHTPSQKLEMAQRSYYGLQQTQSRI